MIEMYATSIRLIAYDNVEENYSEIDITGGYGKKSIPLYCHYVQDEPLPLIGEDALLYDEEEILFVESIYESEQWFNDYMKVLLSKVSNHHFRDTLTQIIFIYPQYMTMRHLMDLRMINDIPVQWVTFETCSSSYERFRFEHYNELIHSNFIFDELNVYVGTYEDNTFFCKTIPFSLLECDIYYRERLKSFHSQEISDFKILKLYDSQKSIIQQQILTKKDVNVYSSLSYPPQKITLKYQEIFEFLRQWDSEYGVNFLQKTKFHQHNMTVIATSMCDHPIIKSFFGKKLSLYHREDFLLSKGCIYSLVFLPSESLKQPILFEDTYIIRVDNRIIKIIHGGNPFLRLVKVELVLTGRKNDIELAKLKEVKTEATEESTEDAIEESSIKAETDITIINKLTIDINQSIGIIHYCIQFDKDKNVSEVYYELRRV